MRFCPRQGCDGIIKGHTILASKLKCPTCKTTVCFKCRDFWHGHFTSCDRHMMKKFNGKVKFCPLCKVKTMKNEGCNHMTCYFCGYHWCWVCNGEGTPEHWNLANPFGCGASKFM